MRRKTLKFLDLVRFILETLRVSLFAAESLDMPRSVAVHVVNNALVKLVS